MKTNVISYLEKIIEKSNNKITKRFDFSNFDTVNIFLIKQILIKPHNLWFETKETDLSKFYESIIFTISVDFFEKNHCENKKIKPKEGDKYKNKRRRTFKVLSIKYDNASQCEIVKLQGISRGNSATVSLGINDLYDSYTKLSDEVAENNRTPTKPMLKFVKNTLDITEQIPSFPHKFAIVAQKNELENSFKILDKKAFPYTYIAGSGVKTENIELAYSMFFVASSYETIQEYIFDKEIKLELIIFIGNKYDCQIQQDIDREYFKQAIFVGEKMPDVQCLKWCWTLPEYQYFRGLTQSQIKVIKVKNDDLTKLTTEFTDNIKKLEKKYYLDLKRLFPYVSYIYPLVVLIKDSRLKNRVEELLYSFEKKSKQVLGEEFSNIGEDDTEAYNLLVGNYKAILEQFYIENNAKTQALQQAIETDYLLVPERQTSAVWQDEIKQLNWQKVKIISLSGFKKISKPKSITIISLNDYDFYCSIKGSNHKINWLLYDDEYKLYKNFAIRYDNKLISEYKSKDRKKLTGVDYPDEIQSESIDDLQGRIWSNEIDKNKYVATDQDYINKKITFTDAHKIELSANSTIILIDKHSKPKKYKVSDLSIGDKIRVYDNQRKEVLFDIVSKHDENDGFNEILGHSKLWKKILIDYCVKDKTSKINEIADLCNVAYSTVEGWLKENSNTKFPKNIKPLKGILSDNYSIIYKSNKRYNSIMIALGRDFSDEVSDYIISKQKGKLLSQFDDGKIKIISERNMPTRTIKKIAIINKQTQ